MQISKSGVSTLSRLERLMVVLALGIIIAIWSSYLTESRVPNTDFYGFYTTAHALYQGSTPDSFKRAPLYVGFLVPFADEKIPSSQTIFMGRVISLIGYLVLGAGLYVFLRQFCPRIALPLTFLYVLNPHYLLFVSLQPIADSWLSAGAVIGALGITGGSWVLSLIGLTLAGSARYDGFTLFPSVLSHFRLLWKNWRFWLGLGLCLFPAFSWLSWGWYVTGHPSPYVQEVEDAGSSGWRFLAVMIFTLFANFLPQSLLEEQEILKPLNFLILSVFGISLFAGLGIGLRELWRQGYKPILLSIGIYAVLYTILHMGFAASLPRYTLPVNWVFFWLLGVFLERCLDSASTRTISQYVLVALSVSIAVSFVWQGTTAWFWWIGAVVLILGLWIAQWRLTRYTVGIALTALLVVQNLSVSSAYWSEQHLQRNAELVEFAEWYRQHGKSQKVATFSWAHRYLTQYEHLDPSHILTIPGMEQKYASAWLAKNGIRWLLWNETELYFERVSSLNPTYAASIRQRYGEVGISGSYIHRVHSGKVKGWREVRTFKVGKRKAVLYERVF